MKSLPEGVHIAMESMEGEEEQFALAARADEEVAGDFLKMGDLPGLGDHIDEGISCFGVGAITEDGGVVSV